MHHRQARVLAVRRIAVVFDALVPVDLPDDVVAFRLVGTTELAAELCGVEVLPQPALPAGTTVPGARKGFWDRRARRALPALPAPATERA